MSFFVQDLSYNEKNLLLLYEIGSHLNLPDLASELCAVGLACGAGAPRDPEKEKSELLPPSLHDRDRKQTPLPFLAYKIRG